MRVIRKATEVFEAVQVKDLLNGSDVWPVWLEREYMGFGDPVVTTRRQFLTNHYTSNPESWLLVSKSGISVHTNSDFSQRFDRVDSRPATQGLTFTQLRQANIKRIPLFKNRKGVVVHKPDGSDLSVAEWFRNLMGEAGEFAGWHKKWQLGEIDDEVYKKESAKELADIQTYLDILAYRVGVDLGEATRQKFNEVSERFGCEVRL